MKSPLDTKSLGVDIPDGMLVPHKKIIFQLIAVIGIGLTAWIWFGILGATAPNTLYVLDVGQGDSQLVILASEDGRSAIKILIDGGRDKTVLTALDKALGNLNNKYLDLVIATHTDLDHIGGLIEVARRYDIGMFISNGREGTSEAYNVLKETLAERAIPAIALLEGDVIRYGDNTLTVLSPDKALVKSKSVNEASLVMMLQSENTKTLFVGDIGFSTENMLLKKKEDLTADILKVGHHGSKNSSGENFIAAVRPTVSVIGVGKKNRYGHPAPRVLETLLLADSRVYRTDEDGTIKIPLDAQGDDLAETGTPSTGLLAAVASVVTGGYKNPSFTTVSLRQAREKTSEFNLVPYKECSFLSGGTPKHSPVIISEIAWMGSPSGATHEWIELRNISPANVNMSGWQILNENERLRITFPQKSIFETPYMMLARSAAREALGLDATLVFTGSLRNSNEGLQLYDNECNLIDEVPVSTAWAAGNNASKQTMERMNDLSWRTSASVGGTPNEKNTVDRASAPALSPVKSSPSTTGSFCKAGQININTASKKDLMNIRHIGEVRADAIINNRPFSSLLELRGRVSGIGETRLADIIAEGAACAAAS
ncbi:MAG: ComE operon protein 3 [candidate division WS2 bacterium]|nr:ComE operon protein 3 [Candidatus Lithacetigena glycinireducens]